MRGAQRALTAALVEEVGRDKEYSRDYQAYLAEAGGSSPVMAAGLLRNLDQPPGS